MRNDFIIFADSSYNLIGAVTPTRPGGGVCAWVFEARCAWVRGARVGFRTEGVVVSNEVEYGACLGLLAIGYHSARMLVARPFGIRIFPSSVEGVSVLGGVRTFYQGNARKRLTPVVRAREASWVITRKFDSPPPDSQ